MGGFYVGNGAGDRGTLDLDWVFPSVPIRRGPVPSILRQHKLGLPDRAAEIRRKRLTRRMLPLDPVFNRPQMPNFRREAHAKNPLSNQLVFVGFP